MRIEEFEQSIQELSQMIEIELTPKQIRNFYDYMENLLEWNDKINLTAIVEPREIIIKHFIDCLTINKYIQTNDKIIDVGTGAGFPGIPIKIVNEQCSLTLLDSLNKRVLFLRDTIEKLQLNKIEAIHARAEEVGNSNTEREKYDIAVSRAVAPLNVLVEYLIPFVKPNGKVICMKGSDIEEELQNAKKAINLLGGKIKETHSFKLPNTDMQRNIIIIEKVKNTPLKYPRKAGTPSKTPIV